MLRFLLTVPLTVVILGSAFADDRIRVTGNVVLQDTNKRYVGSDVREQVKDGGEVNITYEQGTAWFSSSRTAVDDMGGYGFFGKRTSAGDAVKVGIDAKLGKFSSISTEYVNVNGGAAKAQILLRSPANASAAVFDRCNAIISDMGGLDSVRKGDLLKDSKAKECLEYARSFFDKPEISSTIGDIMDIQNDLDGCINTFEVLSSFYVKLGNKAKAEQAVLRSALCRERQALRSNNAHSWDALSQYAKKMVEAKINDGDIRVKMMRIWFDSMVRKISPDGDMAVVAAHIASNGQLSDEWTSLFYQNYFWGRRDRRPVSYGVRQISDDLKELSGQFYRK